MNCLLTIAASDGSGCAGIQQDLRVMDRLGYRGVSVLTAVTLQDFKGLQSVNPLPDETFEAQLKYYLEHLPIKGIKLGALCSTSQVEIAAHYLKQREDIPLVADPVFAPTRGASFLEEEGIQLYREKIVPLTDLLIPNLHEWKRITEHLAEGALSGCVYISGGHSPAKKGFGSVYLQEEFRHGSYSRIYYKKKHNWEYSRGTGCAFSSATCAFMAQGMEPEEACLRAGRWMNRYYRQLNCRFKGPVQNPGGDSSASPH